jgi:two-component system LytT family response regulator
LLIAVSWGVFFAFYSGFPTTNIILIYVKDIDWIEQEGNYARLHLGVRTCDIRETLTNLESRLDPRSFVRIHRSILVNVRRIKKIQP